MHEETRLSQRSFFYCGYFCHEGGVASIENVFLFSHHAKGQVRLEKSEPSLGLVQLSSHLAVPAVALIPLLLVNGNLSLPCLHFEMLRA